MGFSNRTILEQRIDTITADVEGIDTDLWAGTLDDVINQSKFFIAERLVNRGWSFANLQTWARLEEIHTCIALHDFIIQLEVLKSEVDPALLAKLAECRTELDTLEILLDSNGVEVPRSDAGADAGTPVLSTSKGKARTHGRDYDNEIEDDDVFYLEEPFH